MPYILENDELTLKYLNFQVNHISSLTDIEIKKSLYREEVFNMLTRPELIENSINSGHIKFRSKVDVSDHPIYVNSIIKKVKFFNDDKHEVCTLISSWLNLTLDEFEKDIINILDSMYSIDYDRKIKYDTIFSELEDQKIFQIQICLKLYYDYSPMGWIYFRIPDTIFPEFPEYQVDMGYLFELTDKGYDSFISIVHNNLHEIY